ncbi:NADH-quinone oxidoreductase subunit M [Gordonia sp. HNM0687]|uniref:NADH-quinone oxidoreductase subunit M n=1 Tax=Gordonia mangrovi TaxID=2665643 RepID=A0A6L7GPV5_9ACTN|nr:NADH-quinone oxidoreductase subunit M [Gordonia mangrovi]MXP21633.1 NADH-quinone oxidoreductase subunit M [Gordonia mangrovi]UVF80373.1 NADH-quinone oxidoreductase subunit M [Gordonia mangrovi]
MNAPWLTILWLLPAVGGAAALAVPNTRPDLAKWWALAVSLATFGVSLGLAVGFDADGARYQFVEDLSWIPAIGTRYALGIDGIGLALILLTTVLLPILILAGWHDADHSGSLDHAGGRKQKGPHIYLALMLSVEAMVLMSFVALDILLFYIFFEAMLIPMYFLIGGFGVRDGVDRSRAAVKFLLYNLFGGLIMLAAVIGLYVVTARSGLGTDGTGTFDLRVIVDAVAAGELDAGTGLVRMLFLGFMFAFAVKAPLWPFHGWLPDAAVSATPASAVLMMAVVDKVGTFAMLRYCLQLFPDAARYFAPLIATLAVIGIVYGALLAIGQTDVMRLIAYTSISHFGFIILGIFALTSQGQTGSTLYMVNHGISTAALFLIAGFLVSRRGSRLIADYGGVQKIAPVLAGTFLVAGLATLSLPGLAPFISEFLVLIGTYTRYPVAAIAAASALVLSAIYILWLYQRMMGGPPRPMSAEGPGAATRPMRDLHGREVAVVAPLLALLLVFGVYPKPLLDIIDPAVAHTMSTIGEQDPAPTIAVPTEGER